MVGTVKTTARERIMAALCFGSLVFCGYGFYRASTIERLIIMQWGPSGAIELTRGNPVPISGRPENEMVVDGTLLLSYRSKYKLVGACFHNIGTGDVLDRRLSKSALYDIQDSPIRITIPWSHQYAMEVSEGNNGTGYDLLGVPLGVSPDQFETLRQALALGCKRLKRVSGPP